MTYNLIAEHYAAPYMLRSKHINLLLLPFITKTERQLGRLGHIQKLILNIF